MITYFTLCGLLIVGHALDFYTGIIIYFHCHFSFTFIYVEDRYGLTIGKNVHPHIRHYSFAINWVSRIRISGGSSYNYDTPVWQWRRNTCSLWGLLLKTCITALILAICGVSWYLIHLVLMNERRSSNLKSAVCRLCRKYGKMTALMRIPRYLPSHSCDPLNMKWIDARRLQ